MAVPVRVLAAALAATAALSVYEMSAMRACSAGETLASSAAGALRGAAAAPLGALSSAAGLVMLGPLSHQWKASLTSVGEDCRASSPTGLLGTAALYWVLASPLHALAAFVAFNVALSAWGAVAGGLTVLNNALLNDALPFFSFRPTGIAAGDREKISGLGWRLINVPRGFYVPLWILIALHWSFWLPTILSNIALGRWRRFTHRFRKGPVVYRRGMRKPTAAAPNMDGEADWEVDWVDELLRATPAMMAEMEEFVRRYELGDFGDPSDHYELVNFVPMFGRNLANHSTWSRELDRRCQGLRETIRATAGLAGEENVLVAKIVRLEPKRGGSGVQLHVDVYPNVVNVLIPIRAPKDKSFFYINGGGVIPFETGEPLVFNPSFLHAAWNDSEDVTRYVYNIAVSTGSFGSLKRLCAYNFTYVGASGLPGVDASAPRGRPDSRRCYDAPGPQQEGGLLQDPVLQRLTRPAP